VIAHRLPTLYNAKKIIILEDGKVKDEVTYAELCQMKGLSYKLNLLDEIVKGKSILITFR
jgi:ABC-type transport system involved in Fe-S cluster assembly fused permease/ATPase subunit